MSKRYYIRTGRSIEEILVRRKLEQQDKNEKYASASSSSKQNLTRNLPPLQRSSLDGSIRSANIQDEINILNDVSRGSRSDHNASTQAPSQNVHFQAPPHAQQPSIAQNDYLIPPSYPYPVLEDRVRDREKQEMIAALAVEYQTLTARIQVCMNILYLYLSY